MFSLLRRNKVAPLLASAPSGFTQPACAQTLLALPRRQKLLENIWQRASLSHPQFADLYQGPLNRYAELVQQLPASQNHHHAHPGGMLDHGLEIVAYALKIRQTYLLPIGAPPESQCLNCRCGLWGAQTLDVTPGSPGWQCGAIEKPANMLDVSRSFINRTITNPFAPAGFLQLCRQA